MSLLEAEGGVLRGGGGGVAKDWWDRLLGFYKS